MSLCGSPLWLQSVPLHAAECCSGLQENLHCHKLGKCAGLICVLSRLLYLLFACSNSSNTSAATLPTLAQHCCCPLGICRTSRLILQCPICSCLFEQAYYLIFSILPSRHLKMAPGFDRAQRLGVKPAFPTL